MDERRLRKFFHFTENDLEANRHGQLSDSQEKKLSAQARAEQKSARDSATILFVVAAMGLGLGLILTLAAPTPVSRVFFVLLLVILWPSVWGGKGIQILRAARGSQEPRLLSVSGHVRLIRHTDTEPILQVGEVEFDLDASPAGVIMEGDEYTVYYLDASVEILSVDLAAGKK